MKKAVQHFVSLARRLIRGRASDKIGPDLEWAAEVERRLSFLFIEHGANLVDSTYRTGSFGLKTAVIKVGNILLKVSRDVTLPPNYIEARIAPVHAPADFRSPVSAWLALGLTANGAVPLTPPYKEFGTLQGLSNLLQQNFVPLNEAYSTANYPSIRQKISEIEEKHWQQWKQEQSHTGGGMPR